MAGILDLIPEVGKLIDRFVPDPQRKLEAERMMKELDVRELEARMGVQKAWLSNNSLFVAGAIPTILWMVSLVIFFNHILASLIQGVLGKTLPILDLPPWYSSLAGTVVLGLFGKKAWDSTEIHYKGETLKPAKEKIHSELEEPKPAAPVSPVKKKAAPPANGKAASHVSATPPAEPQQEKKDYTPEEIDARLQALYQEKGIEP
jgi:hypothetical protein